MDSSVMRSSCFFKVLLRLSNSLVGEVGAGWSNSCAYIYTYAATLTDIRFDVRPWRPSAAAGRRIPRLETKVPSVFGSVVVSIWSSMNSSPCVQIPGALWSTTRAAYKSHGQSPWGQQEYPVLLTKTLHGKW